MRTILSGALRIGKATATMLDVAVMLALIMGVASAAFGANGDFWKLGKGNTATAITALGGTLGVNGPMLRLTNNNAGTDDTALELKVQPGEAPMSVNSHAKVNNLDSDSLDGRDSASFVTNSTYRLCQGQELAGTQLSDNTRVLSQSCLAGDRLLSGGTASVRDTSSVLDSYASDTITWTSRINPHGAADNWTVVVLCADQ